MATVQNQCKFGLIIDNVDVNPPAGFEVLAPISGEVIHVAPAANEELARKAVESAAAVFDSWCSSTPIERRIILNEAARVLELRKAELVSAMVQETGAKPSWAAFNVNMAIQLVMEAAGMATQIKGELLQSNNKGTIAMVYKEPCGVVLGIAPWNAPIILGVRAFIVPLLCGNTVIFKASESSPYTQYLLVDSFRQAGLPAGVLNYISCTRTSAEAITESIVSHHAVRRVNFTGSTAVGYIIASMCARYLKPAVLELGGKAPLVILKDANLEEASKAAIFGAIQHQGQICMSTERIIVHRSVSKKFAELLSAKMKNIHAADPSLDENATLGPLINPAAGERVSKLVNDALSKGAKILCGTHAVDKAIMQPLLLRGITQEMNLYYQESFGPVAALFEFETNEEAIKLANDTEYGLVSAVFSDNIVEALHVARRIKSGSCHINGPTIHDEPHFPLGGQKASGYGRFGGSACINEFTEDRVVTIASQGHHYPF